MIFDIEREIRALLAPFKNRQILLTARLTDKENLLKLRTAIENVLQKNIATLPLIAPPNTPVLTRSSLYRKWILLCHPDKGAITQSLNIDNKLVISAHLMKELEQVFSDEEKNTDNKGNFFNVIHKIFNQNQELTSTEEEKANLNNITQVMEDSIIKNKLYTIINAKVEVAPLKKLIYLFLSPNNYYVGTLRKWLEIQLKNKIQEARREAPQLSQAEFALRINAIFENSLVKKAFGVGEWTKIINEALANEAPNLKCYSISDVSIAYHLQVALEELNRVFINGTIYPRGFANHYKSYDKFAYYEYQMYLTLWHILYADPSDELNFSQDRTRIYKMAEPAYTNKQYKILSELFADEPSEEKLAALGLNKEMLAFFNTKLCRRGNWNWLRETTNWLYAHGREVAIVKPYTTRSGSSSENYLEAYYYVQFDKLWKSICNHKQAFKLGRYGRNAQILIFTLPALAFTVPLFIGLFLLFSDIISIGLLAYFIPFFIAIAIPGNSVSYAFLESCLDNLARLSKPSILPEGLNSYHAEILLPLKRIIFNPIDDYYSQKTKITLQSLYLLRISVGMSLMLFASLFFIAQKVMQYAIHASFVSYFFFFNLRFDFGEHVATLKGAFFKFKEAPFAFFSFKKTEVPAATCENKPPVQENNLSYAKGILYLMSSYIAPPVSPVNSPEIPSSSASVSTSSRYISGKR